MEAKFKWVVWHLCFMEHFGPHIFPEWAGGVGREKGMGLKEIDLILPGLVFFRDVGNWLDFFSERWWV